MFDDVVELLFDLKLDSIDVFFYSCEVLLLLLLPLQQPLHPLHADHLSVYHPHRLFVSRQLSADLLYAPTDLHHV